MNEAGNSSNNDSDSGPIHATASSQSLSHPHLMTSVWYSPNLDGLFCGPCLLLLPSNKRRDRGLLVNTPYSNWSKISNAVSNHSSPVAFLAYKN